MGFNPTIIRKDSWPSGDGKIILTFDDGPNPDSSVSFQLLDVLRRHNVKATFCYIGENMKTRPDVVRRAVQEGHAIAFHSFTHTPWAPISLTTFERELANCKSTLAQITGNDTPPPSLYRTPWGILTPAINRTLAKHQLKVAHISFFVNDAWSTPGNHKARLDDIKKKLINNNGGAIVLHEHCQPFIPSIRVDKSWLPGAAEELIQWARDREFGFSLYPNQRRI